MKFTSAALLLATAGSFVAAQPHRHNHRHAHKRDDTKIVAVPGPTELAFVFDGQSISEDDVCKGIDAGTLTWAEGTANPPKCAGGVIAPPAPAPAPVPALAPAPVAATPAAEFHQQIPASSSAAPVPSPAPAAPIPAAPAPASAAPAPVAHDQSSKSGPSSSNTGSNSNVDRDFPDGQLDCSTFPSDYGAIDVEWVKFGGWSGIQYISMGGDGKVSNIDTPNPFRDTADGSWCAPKNGKPAMCSYACPAGYQKSQWPTAQGETGQSVGGLMCGTDNKLHLTNPGLSHKLCISGTGKVEVQNKLGTNAPICRTDYPGTESETVPLDTADSTTSELTCPDASSYYKWLNSATSAEYYLNMKGTPVQTACNWSSDGSSVGNWAPVVLGVGTDTSQATWLSIMTTIQNHPTTYRNLDYNVELQGDFGGSKCFYVFSNGQGYYCNKGSPNSFQPSDCQTTSTASVPGCTVQLMSGKASYVLSQ